MEVELNDRFRSLVEKAARKEGFINFTTHAEVGSAKGDNYLGTITKVKVSDVESNKTINLILKSSAENPEFRKHIPMAEAFNRETYFYTNVLGAYRKLLKEYNLKFFNSFATLVESDLDIPEVLVMTDMKAAGFVMRDRKQFLDLKHVKLVMQAYGELHGLYYALKTLKPEESKELYNNMAENFFANVDIEASQTSVEVQNNKVRKCFRDDDVFVRERFEVFCEDQMTKILENFKPTAAGRFAVINHGDSWINNMLFAYNGEDAEQPTNICLLDFQLSRIGSPAMDLSYFIFTCTSKTLRDQYYNEILQTYHDALRDLLKGFSLNVEDYLTMDELHEQMRRFSLYGIYMTMGVTHVMLSDADEIPEFQNAQIDTDTDLKDTFKSFDYVSKNEDVYLERMRGVLVDCTEKGYI